MAFFIPFYILKNGFQMKNFILFLNIVTQIFLFFKNFPIFMKTDFL